MHIVEKSFVEMVAQEWYVLAAYFGTFVLLEIRKYGERIAMHRVARHALWAASVVVVLHSIVAAAAMIRRSGLDFVVIDYALVMTLTGSLVYLLGCMFEESPQSAFARLAEASMNTDWLPLERMLRPFSVCRLYVHGSLRTDSSVQTQRHETVSQHCSGWDMLSLLSSGLSANRTRGGDRARFPLRKARALKNLSHKVHSRRFARCPYKFQFGPSSDRN